MAQWKWGMKHRAHPGERRSRVSGVEMAAAARASSRAVCQPSVCQRNSVQQISSAGSLCPSAKCWRKGTASRPMKVCWLTLVRSGPRCYFSSSEGMWMHFFFFKLCWPVDLLHSQVDKFKSGCPTACRWSFLFTPRSPIQWCLLFLASAMPGFSSCDNTRTRDLKRHFVKHKPVTHAAIQKLPLTRLTWCRHSDECYRLSSLL